MRPLDQLVDTEKARLLHELFPKEIAALLDFVAGFAQSMTQHQIAHRKEWQGQIVRFDFWLQLSGDTARRIKKHKTKLCRDAGFFCDQLFEGHNALFMVDCLIKYTTIRQHPNVKFSKAVDLLFTP